jgi:hypothetical protein
VRRGAAASIQDVDPVTGPWKKPATVAQTVTPVKNGVNQPQITGHELALLGPGAVARLDSKVVLRTDPRDGATGVEDNYLVLIEFARADLPWMFSPAKPNAQNRLRPWLVLIVVHAARVSLQAGSPLPRISVNDSELPNLDDSWGWAHAQVTVDKDDLATAAAELLPATGTSAISRLLCPRRLDPNTDYLACVVPATEPGRRAGLGAKDLNLNDPDPEIKQAWTVGAGQDVILPVYYSWRFSTGDAGDFKSLVSRIRPPSQTDVAGFGVRKIDVSAPWQQGDPLPADAIVGLGGALGTGADVPLPPDAEALFKPRLTALLNFPAALQPRNPNADPTFPTLSAVAPPIYGGRHASKIQVPDTPGWLRTLNTDPRRRIAAAFGTRYVQENQEFLMAQAWDQLGAVEEANRMQALAELAAETADRMHQRHIAGLSSSRMMAMAAPARTRVLTQPGAGAAAMTLHAVVASTPVPTGAATVSFSRMSRAQGPIGTRTFNGKPATVIEKGFTGSLKIPPMGSDGIAKLAVAPAAPARPDATSSLVSRSWQQVVELEKTIPSSAAAMALLKTTNANISKPANTNVLVLAPPTALVPVIPAVAQSPDAIALLTAQLAESLRPSIGIPKRFQSRVQIPPSLGGGSAARVMAYPQFTAPLAMAIKDSHPDWLLPGVGTFPDNSVTLLQADAAFVEAFLVGANHEMNREFLWRGYPTDQRGTPFRYFWPRADRQTDIPPITSWPLNTELGSNGTKVGKDVENMIVLLVRGELLHHYPRLIVRVGRGKDNGGVPTLDMDDQWLPPDFTLRLDDRTTAFAFNLQIKDVTGNPGRYFVFSEPLTGPRFNFDASPSPNLQFWTDMDWGKVGPVRGFAIAGNPIAPPPEPQGASWNNNSADIARIAFARPFQVGYHADELLPKVEGA